MHQLSHGATSKPSQYKVTRKMPHPDLTIFFSKEVEDWDTYLSTWLRNNSNEDIVITHETLESIVFPLTPSTVQNFANSRVVLVIISPAFLDFLNQNAENIFKIGLLLKPKWTVAMLCGVQEDDISSFHKDALVSYDKWLHLIAKHRDSAMVNNMIRKVQNLLSTSREGERLLKPGFKLVPLKVQEGKGKVFIIFKKPIQEECKKIKVYLDVNSMKEVQAKQINPYNWQFLIPDTYMSRMRLLNVHVYHDDNLIGIRQVKCESKMGELSTILLSSSSPYEFMCTTLGMASKYDVDEYLAKTFKESMPPSGLLSHRTEKLPQRGKSKDELPTLLHFAARYGMCQLTKEIIQCPFAQSACCIKNAKDLNPVQLASHHAHHDVATILIEYQRSLKCSVTDIEVQEPIARKDIDSSLSHDGYDFPSSNPVPVSHFVGIDNNAESSIGQKSYLKSSASLNHEDVRKSPFLTPEKCDAEKRLSLDMQTNVEPVCSEKIESDFLKSQSKLIEIIKSYKKGATLVEVERMQNDWKSHYQVSDMEAKQPLEAMRNMYAKAQKSKLNKNKSSSLTELFQMFGSKLRRKDSVTSKSSLIFSRKKASVEPCESDTVRPMSTLSTTSNTSSSSGSSFDALSSASAGSDSGNHSDNCDDRNHYKYPSQMKVHFNSDLRRDVLCTNHKPPAPPPRPSKTYIKPNTLPIHGENMRQQFALSQMTDFKAHHIIHNTRSIGRKGSLFTNIVNPMDCYDIPSLSRERRRNSFSSGSTAFPLDNFNYDLVPPPLPLSPKPLPKVLPKSEFGLKNFDAQLYDVPSFLADYDFPKTNYTDKSVDMKDLQNVSTSSSKQKFDIKCKCNISKNASGRDVTCDDISSINASSLNNNIHNSTLKPHYCNIVPNLFDSVPDEIAPNPPVENTADSEEAEEKHYKIVGIPVPIEIFD